jgi:hypothetical protein
VISHAILTYNRQRKSGCANGIVITRVRARSHLQDDNTEKTRDTIMKDNPLKQLGTLGQSIWLDYIRRDLIVGGELRRLIVEDGLRGMTSNPSIFEKAIADSHDYDENIRVMALQRYGYAPAFCSGRRYCT